MLTVDAQRAALALAKRGEGADLELLRAADLLVAAVQARPRDIEPVHIVAGMLRDRDQQAREAHEKALQGALAAALETFKRRARAALDAIQM